MSSSYETAAEVLSPSYNEKPETLEDQSRDRVDRSGIAGGKDCRRTTPCRVHQVGSKASASRTICS
jgi:hypothetical protein